MGFELATIEQIQPAGPSIKVMFNPREYRLGKANQFAEVAIPGLSSSPLQFTRGNPRTLSMQLFFDTYTTDQKPPEDVQTYTGQIMALLQIKSSLHAPPICKFVWGKKLEFTGVLERAEQRFTLFYEDGTPVRATVDVTFKEFVEDTAHTESANYFKHHVVRRGDNLSAISAQMYGDPSLWRHIAEANELRNPLALRPGQVLVIPSIE